MPRCRSTGGALMEVLDIRDILMGCWSMVKIVFCRGDRHLMDHDGNALENEHHDMTSKA